MIRTIPVPVEPNSILPAPVLDICIPYSDAFVGIVKSYQEQFSRQYTVIHSTVAVGTADQLGAVHSPVRGVHPDLEAGVRTFVKFFGGRQAGAEAVAQLFVDKGVEVKVFDNARDTEADKIWSTTQYGLSIILQKELYAYCQEHGLDFDVVYTQFNQTYNEGYQALDRPEYTRYVLKHHDGPIGGHCVVPNLVMLDSPTARRIEAFNETLK